MKNNFLRFKNIKQFHKTSSLKGHNIFYIKYLTLLLALIGNSFQTKAQNRYTINVPIAHYTSISQPAATDALDIQHLIDEITKYAKIYKKNICIETLDSEISQHLRTEMKRIKEGTAYTLAVDYEACKFISLLPDKGSGEISSKNWTVYHITLYQDIISHPDFPSTSITKKNEKSSSKTPIVATFIDENGQWIAMGPYMTTDGYPSEKQAIGSLFYSDSDLKFLCEKGKFRIYAFKGKVEHDSRDIRAALKLLGIDNIPE